MDMINAHTTDLNISTVIIQHFCVEFYGHLRDKHAGFTSESFIFYYRTAENKLTENWSFLLANTMGNMSYI